MQIDKVCQYNILYNVGMIYYLPATSVEVAVVVAVVVVVVVDVVVVDGVVAVAEIVLYMSCKGCFLLWKNSTQNLGT